MIKSVCGKFEMIIEPCLVHNDVFRCIVLHKNSIVEVSRQHLNSVFTVTSSDSLPLFVFITVNVRKAKFRFEHYMEELENAYDSFFQ